MADEKDARILVLGAKCLYFSSGYLADALASRSISRLMLAKSDENDQWFDLYVRIGAWCYTHFAELV